MHTRADKDQDELMSLLEFYAAALSEKIVDDNPKTRPQSIEEKFTKIYHAYQAIENFLHQNPFPHFVKIIESFQQNNYELLHNKNFPDKKLPSLIMKIKTNNQSIEEYRTELSSLLQDYFNKVIALSPQRNNAYDKIVGFMDSNPSPDAFMIIEKYKRKSFSIPKFKIPGKDTTTLPKRDEILFNHLYALQIKTFEKFIQHLDNIFQDLQSKIYSLDEKLENIDDFDVDNIMKQISDAIIKHDSFNLIDVTSQQKILSLLKSDDIKQELKQILRTQLSYQQYVNNVTVMPQDLWSPFCQRFKAELMPEQSMKLAKKQRERDLGFFNEHLDLQKDKFLEAQSSKKRPNR